VRFADIFRGGRRADIEVLRARFARFRRLLEKNNRVLYLIADANEKLGGEYVFDSQYLLSLEAELGEAVSDVVRDLAEMSDNGYPGLSSQFERVRAMVQASIKPHQIDPDVPLTLTIDELGTELADVVGEKMARLGEIRRRLALRVPDGFVITARACDLVLARPEIAAEFEKYRAGSDGAAAGLRQAILASEPPAEVTRAIKEALKLFGRDARFAVRSSALGEDSDLTFAGQHTTILNVPREHVATAWLKVVASLFSAKASGYRRNHGLPAAAGEMAVGCLLMVPACAGGVLYSVDPNAPASGTIIVSAARGLGGIVVDGRGFVDEFKLSRQSPHHVLARQIADKKVMYVAVPEGGTHGAAVPAEQRRTPAITDETLAALAEAALRIERHMRCPQDVEWAVGSDNRLFVLQSRPLRLPPTAPHPAEEVLSACARHRVLISGHGEVACRGIGAGRVFLVGPDEATEGFLPGDVLVTRYASPRLAELVAGASALVSDVGSVTGHLATVAREYRVPAIVGTRDATGLLSAGTVVTVDANENTVYEGSVEELLRYQLLRSQPYEETQEFRALRHMLRHVSPLNQRDPSSPEFEPEHCLTYHDIIRFAHERALAELGRLSDFQLEGGGTSARTLELDIPLDLVLIDLGGGIAPGVRGRTLSRRQVTSRPLEILLQGLLAPGVWSTNPAEMDLNGLMASATRAGPLTVPGGDVVRRNVAIVSADYLNLNLRIGYHFNVVDCYFGENPEDSYILFRFVGGVTDVMRRTRRARLLASILSQLGFKTDLSGELIIGRLQGVPQSLCAEQLRMVGRLIGFSRQLDILLRDDRTVDKLVNEFLESKFQMTLDTLLKERDNADRHCNDETGR
jgi:pyruvate,water dikinase